MTVIPQEASGSPSAAAEDSSLAETVVSSRSSVRFIQAMKDLWIYRDLFRAFIARDVKVRYKQTALGVIWIVLQPLAAAGLFTVVFQQLGNRQGERPIDSLLFFMAGLIPYTSFASAVQNASTSMEMNAHLITKVYFPRLIVPGAYVCGSAFDFVIAFCILLLMAAVANSFSVWLILMTPLLLVIQLAFSAAIGLVFGALNAQYRDVKYVVPFLLQMGLLVTVLASLSDWHNPIIYAILSYSPMTSVVETYRAILSDAPIDAVLLGKGAAVSILGLVVGIGFFRAREARMADIL